MSWSVQAEFVPGTVAETCYKCKMPLRAESPTGLPGHEHALDTGVNIDFEGFLAFCESCIIEAADLLGMVPAAVHDAVRDTVDAVWAEVDEARRERDLAVAALESLQSFNALPDPEPEEELPNTKEALQLLAIEREVEVDARWGVARLQDAIRAAK
jgi:hypothetical protein